MYDLIVLGGGPGGYTGAIRAAKWGMKVALIEKEALGGTCLNRGCIPTKALLHAGALFDSRQDWPGLGIETNDIRFDEAKAYENKDNIVAGLRSGIETLINANKIDLYRGVGRLAGASSVLVGGQNLSAGYILLATGSVPGGYDPNRPIEGIDSALTSDDVLKKPLPGSSVVIIGAGVIGVEFAYYFAAAGKKVTLLAPSERIIKMTGKDTSAQLAATLKKKGVEIIVNARPVRVTPHAVVYSCPAGEREAKADAVVAAVGRRAVTADIGLESVGLQPTRCLAVDDNMYTGVKGIYACGDLIGRTMLAHYAAASAVTAVESMLNKPHETALSLCPSCIYTLPEIASVGAKESEGDFKVSKFLMGGNGKALIEGCARGFIKIIADKEDTVVGAELFCLHATDILGELTLAVAKKLKVKELAAVIRPHPTVMEAIGECLEDFDGLATHAMPKRL